MKDLTGPKPGNARLDSSMLSFVASKVFHQFHHRKDAYDHEDRKWAICVK